MSDESDQFSLDALELEEITKDIITNLENIPKYEIAVSTSDSVLNKSQPKKPNTTVEHIIANISTSDITNITKKRSSAVETPAHILLKHIKSISFADININNTKYLNSSDFKLYFTDSKIITDDICDVIFENIDISSHSSITAMDYFQWKDTLNIQSMQDVILKVSKESDNDEIDDEHELLKMGSKDTDDSSLTPNNDRQTTTESNSFSIVPVPNNHRTFESVPSESTTNDTQKPNDINVYELDDKLEFGLSAIIEKDSSIFIENESKIELKEEKQRKSDAMPADFFNVCNDYRQYHYKLDAKEYACVHCLRPVKNNVFIEKDNNDCTSVEIRFELFRMICVLYFLQTEFNFYQTLKEYLKAVENTVEPPTPLIDERSIHTSTIGIRNRTTTVGATQKHLFEQSEVGLMSGMVSMRYATYNQSRRQILQKQNTISRTHHMQFLYNALLDSKKKVRGNEQSSSSKRNSKRNSMKIIRGLGNSKIPDFQREFAKYPLLREMYDHYVPVFREIVYHLVREQHLQQMKYQQQIEQQQQMKEQMKHKISLEHTYNSDTKLMQFPSKIECLKEISTDIFNEEIKRSETEIDIRNPFAFCDHNDDDSDFSTDDDEKEFQSLEYFLRYSDYNNKFNAFYSCTPTEDEMQCYLQLFKVIFAEIPEDSSIKIATYQKIWNAIAILRKYDSAVADRNQGWVTTFDNILNVLMYRDNYYYSKDFIGELQFSFKLHIGKNVTGADLDNRNVIYKIKQSIVWAFNELPSMISMTGSHLYSDGSIDDGFVEDEERIHLDHVILRRKTYVSQIVSDYCCCSVSESQIIEFTFGILVDKSFLKGRENKYYPYRFMFIAKQLFERMNQSRFLKMFDRYSKREKFGFRISEVNTDSLRAVKYPGRERYDPKIYELLRELGISMDGTPAVEDDSVPQFHDWSSGKSIRSIRLRDPHLLSLKSVTGSTGVYGFNDDLKSVETLFDDCFKAGNLRQNADSMFDEEIGFRFEEYMVGMLSKFAEAMYPKILYCRLSSEEIEKQLQDGQASKVDKIIEKQRLRLAEMEEKERLSNIAEDFSRTGADDGNLGKMSSLAREMNENVDRYRSGHKICCGWCFITPGMILMSLLLGLISFLGGYYLWLAQYIPIEPSLEGILSLNDKMLFVEAEEVVERAWFTADKFILFQNLLPIGNLSHIQPLKTAEIDDIFNYYLDDELLVSPRLDGIIFVQFNDTYIISDYILKSDTNAQISCKCVNDDCDTCDDDLSSVTSSLKTYIMSNTLAFNGNTFYISFYLNNEIFDESDGGGDIWYITGFHKEINENISQVICSMFRGSRINAEYASLNLDFDAVVFWITDDEYGDVFMSSSLNTDGYYTHSITDHPSNSSSILLNSEFGYAVDSTTATLDDTISQTKQHLTLWQSDINTDTLYIWSDDNKRELYYVYANKMYLPSNSTFYVVVVYPVDSVRARLYVGQLYILITTVMAIVISMINGCLAVAVPFIPRDDTWLLNPLFTKEDKEEMHDAVDIGIALRHIDEIQQKRKRLSNIPVPTNNRPHGSAWKDRISTVVHKTPTFHPLKVINLPDEIQPTSVKSSEKQPSGTTRNRTEPIVHFAGSATDLMKDRVEQKTPIRVETPSAEKLRGLSEVFMLASASAATITTNKVRSSSLNPKANLPHAATDFTPKYERDKQGRKLSEQPLPATAATTDSMSLTKSSLIIRAQSATSFGRVRNRFGDNHKLSRKQARKNLVQWKKKQQREQIQKNMQHADMQSMFARDKQAHRTTYATWMTKSISLLGWVVCALVFLGLWTFRYWADKSIEDLMDNHLLMSVHIVENHAEFVEYKHSLVLQQGQQLTKTVFFDYTNNVFKYVWLKEYFAIYTDLLGLFVLDTDTFNTTDELLAQNSLFFYAHPEGIDDCLVLELVSTNPQSVCMEWSECLSLNISNIDSYNGIYNNTDAIVGNATDCIMYNALVDTMYYYLIDASNTSTTIVWSTPFVCFYDQIVCYLGVTAAEPGSSLLVGVLMSFETIAIDSKRIIFEESGFADTVAAAELEVNADSGIDYGVYMYGNINGSTDSDYLLSLSTRNTSGNDATTAIAIKSRPYSPNLYSVITPNDSETEIVQKTYAYMNKDTGAVTDWQNNTAVISNIIWGYPSMVYYLKIDTSDLSWIIVLTVTRKFFTGDFDIYATLTYLICLGWISLYLFFHFSSLRRFNANMQTWEMLYIDQLDKDFLDLSFVDEDDDDNDPIHQEFMAQFNDAGFFRKKDNKQFSIYNSIKNSAYTAPTTTALKGNGPSTRRLSAPGDGFHGTDDAAQQQLPPTQPDVQQSINVEQEQILEFISHNIRQTVRKACQESWIRMQSSSDDQDLPTRRSDITNHYHRRALEHISQAKLGMNIITVVQMEQYGNELSHRLRLYELHSNKYWRGLFTCVMLIHMSLVLWRPLTDEDLEKKPYPYPTNILIIETCCLLIELFDIVLAFFIQFQWQDSSKNPLMSPQQQKRTFMARISLWLLIAIDVLVTNTMNFCITIYLPVRPILLVVSIDSLMGAAYAFILTAGQTVDAFLLYCFIWLMAAVFGNLLFRFGNFMDEYNLYSFLNMVRSIMSSFVFILSGENYQEIVYASVDESPWMLLYFLILTMIGSFIVVSLLVSNFQTAFKQIHDLDRKRTRYFKRTGYVAAFALINLDDDDTVSHSEFESFIDYLKTQKKHSDLAQELLRGFGMHSFDSIDIDQSGSIGIAEFVITMEKIYRRPTLIDIINDDNTILSWIRLHVVEQESFSQLVIVITIVEIILLALFGQYPGEYSVHMLDLVMSIAVFLNAIDISIKFMAMGKDYYWNTSKCRIINRHHNKRLYAISSADDMISGTILDPGMIESSSVALKAASPVSKVSAMGRNINVMSRNNTAMSRNNTALSPNSGEEFGEDEEVIIEKWEMEREEFVYTNEPLLLKQREFAHRADLIVVGTTVALFCISRLSVGKFWLDDDDNWERLVMIIPLARLFTLIKTTRAAVYTIFKVLPRFTSLITILFVIFYWYAVWGVAFIGNSLETLLVPPKQSFASIGDAGVTLFQVMVGEGWHDIMYNVISVKDGFNFSVYFISFVMLVTLMFTNLLVGLVLSVVDDMEKELKDKYGSNDMNGQNALIMNDGSMDDVANVGNTQITNDNSLLRGRSFSNPVNPKFQTKLSRDYSDSGHGNKKNAGKFTRIGGTTPTLRSAH